MRTITKLFDTVAIRTLRAVALRRLPKLDGKHRRLGTLLKLLSNLSLENQNVLSFVKLPVVQHRFRLIGQAGCLEQSQLVLVRARARDAIVIQHILALLCFLLAK